jgi:GAF domain-containing protein
MRQRHETDLPTPRGGVPQAPLSFPDQPRLELDELLAQLVDRAQEVMGTQGRLRGLLRANLLVSSDLTLSTVLQRTVEAARELVGAGRAALDVLGPGGTHVESAATGAACGSATPAADGRDLSVSVRVRGEVVGSLRLTDGVKGSFSSEDRELAQALATTAGMAIEHARLYEAARRRGEWLTASAAITRQLLTGEAGSSRPLELIARSSRDVADADVVAVLRPDHGAAPAISLCVDVLVGPDGVSAAPSPVPLHGAVLGEVFSERRAICLTEQETGRLGPLPWAEPHVGAVLAAPLVGSRTVHGVLCAARLPGRPGFMTIDVQMASGFANQAAVAIELAEARAEQQRAAALDERERIAADLHDTVVQQLFSVGLSLQGVLAEVGQGRTAERLRATVDEVDRTIGRIRSTLFPLQTATVAAPDPRDRVLDAVTDAVPALGLEPDLRFSGLLAGSLAVDLVEDVVAVVRGALLDVARRGHATAVSVDLVKDRDGLVVHVRDDDPDGAGAATGDAAADLHRRAERHGGTFTVSAGTPAGTSLYWWVPHP